MTSRPFCWIWVSHQDPLDQLTAFWAAVGHLASEGKDVLSHIINEHLMEQFHHRKLTCDEVVVLHQKEWDNYQEGQKIVQWAEEQGIPVRIMCPQTWAPADIKTK